ncbi:pentapeptide repeat-containing protein [Aquimarina sediminis]|uniref:pentapeptide repeat-containing protein n=1 Tax=Aquimarina sediminis TaxID=2070536 RepID=UPI000CA05554|nr:pentapeptide repeat-containing protein [Aquimarina sediminis]
MSKTKFQNRWVENAANKEALLKITKIAQRGGVLKKEHSPYGITDKGLIDFRGLRLNSMDIKKLKVKDADLSFSEFHDTFIERSKFNNVVFHQTDFSKFRDIGNEFTNVYFLKCKFIEASIGYKGTRFQLSFLEDCNFRRATFTRAEFTNCKITNCKLNGMDFFGSSFENCSFIGEYKDLWFRGGYPHPEDKKDFGRAKRNKMKNVSFEEATLIYLLLVITVICQQLNFQKQVYINISTIGRKDSKS